MKIDPGSQQPDYSAMDAAPVGEGKPARKTPTKTVYPDLTLRDAAADAIIAAHAAGETFDADVTFKVVAIHQSAGGTQPYGGDKGSRVELEIINIEKEDEPEPAEAPDEDAGSAVDSYLANKSAAAPAEED